MKTLITIALTTIFFLGRPAWAKKPFTAREHIAGAVTLLPVPWGFVNVGGSTLRQLPTGSHRWEPLHQIPKDHLSRIAAHPSGRLLATWEKDPNIHFFERAKKLHRLLPKPRPSASGIFYVENLHFTDDGRAAIAVVSSVTGRPPTTTTAWRYDLDAPAAPPQKIFEQPGLLLDSTARAAIFAVPKDQTKACYNNYMGCWPIAEIKAWTIGDREASSKTLLSGEGDKLARAIVVPGSDEKLMAVLIEERPKKRGLLRWRYGKSDADYRALPEALGFDGNPMRLTRDGDLVEVWQKSGDFGLTVQRHDTKGGMKETKWPPLPRRQGMTDTSGVHLVKERENGELFVHWGDYLVLLSPGGITRRMNIEQVPGKHEWAGTDVYVPKPEELWVGVERGGTRDFYLLPFAEIERKAQRWIASK